MKFHGSRPEGILWSSPLGPGLMHGGPVHMFALQGFHKAFSVNVPYQKKIFQ